MAEQGRSRTPTVREGGSAAHGSGRAPAARNLPDTKKAASPVTRERARTVQTDTKKLRPGSVDRIMLALILILVALGSVMVFSASYPFALAERGDSLYYIKRQLGFIAVGCTAMAAASIVPLSWYRRAAIPAYIVSVVLLILVLVMGISEGVAQRWIRIPGTSITIQPSEIMKLAMVLTLAWYMERYHDAVAERLDRRRTVLFGVGIPAAIVGLACGLVLLEKHLSGTVILGLLGVMVMFLGGCHHGWMAAILGGGGACAIGVFLLTNPYALKRITTFTDENADKLDELWQTTQGLYAIGSGGPLGVGLGGSNQKHSYVSAAQNDFIFTIWCEEMGFVGAVALIVLFLLFIGRGFIIAMRAPDIFSSLVVFGIVCQVGIQAFLNMGVVTDVLPNTGISLPFFSYGGTSLMLLLGEMGILLGISRYCYQKP